MLLMMMKGEDGADDDDDEEEDADDDDAQGGWLVQMRVLFQCSSISKQGSQIHGRKAALQIPDGQMLETNDGDDFDGNDKLMNIRMMMIRKVLSMGVSNSWS